MEDLFWIPLALQLSFFSPLRFRKFERGDGGLFLILSQDSEKKKKKKKKIVCVFLQMKKLHEIKEEAGERRDSFEFLLLVEVERGNRRS